MVPHVHRLFLLRVSGLFYTPEGSQVSKEITSLRSRQWSLSHNCVINTSCDLGKSFDLPDTGFLDYKM